MNAKPGEPKMADAVFSRSSTKEGAMTLVFLMASFGAL